MTLKRLASGAAAAALAAAVAWRLSTHAPEPAPDAGAGGRAVVPPLPAPSGTAPRALPPSALEARDAGASRSPAPAPVPHSAAAVTDAANDSLEARLDALARLGKGASADEVGALLDFLARHDADDALPPEKLNALKNDVANALRAQSVFPAALPLRLAEMWGDPAHDDAWRDYCIQHAGAAWERIAAPAARETVRALLWSAASGPSLPGSGTALIALRNLAASGSEDRANVAARAFASAADAAASDGTRVTALQIAAELGHADTAPLARAILASRQNAVHLRMSAAAALGQTGNAADLALLDGLAESSEPRLRAAGTAAAAKLRKATASTKR
jgi:hypothetical protein